MKSKLLAKVLFCISFFITVSSFAQVIPTASFAVNNPSTCVDAPVQVTDLSTDFPTAWSYSVNGMASLTVQNPIISFTASGVYTISLEATNGSGTSSVFSETVFVQSLPTITVIGNTLVCTSAASTLSTTGADTYSWVSGPNTDTFIINPAVNTTYTVIGTSTLTGCSDSSFVSVSTVPLPTISVSDATICAGTTFTLNPSGASTYSFSGGSNTIAPVSNTVYIVSGTDVLTGCSDSVQVNITVSVLSLAATSGSVCSGQPFTIVASGATSYTYSGGSDVVTPSVTTTYTVTGEISGCTDEVQVVVTVIDSPTIVVSAANVCAGSIYTILPTGASNYTFSSGSNTISPITNTNYIVSGTDPVTGCVGSASLAVTVNPLPTITVNSGTICGGQAFTISPNGASTYTVTGNSFIVTPGITTNYSITGTTNGCDSQSPAVATVVVSGTTPSVTVSSTQSGVMCVGDYVTLTASGASTYSWSSGETTPAIVVTATGSTIYTVTGASQGGGCTHTTSILQFISICNGIEKSTATNIEYSLYPNPTNGDLYIENAAALEISIINALGQVVLKQQLEEGKTALDLSAFPGGIYFVNLKQNDYLKTLRVIKN